MTSSGGGSGQAEALRLARESVSVVVNEINETGGRAGLVWWNGEPPRLIPVGDPGYAALE